MLISGAPAGRWTPSGSLFARYISTRHPGENRGPATREASRVEKALLTMDMVNWIPAFAGMTLVCFASRGAKFFCLAGRTVFVTTR